MSEVGSPAEIREDFGSRYRLDHEIGSGGAGIVFAGYDFLLKRPVAIKRLRSDRLDLDSRNNLLLEAESICRIQHPNVVSVFDVGRDQEGGFIVMELLDGFDLEILANDGKLLMEQFRELAIQSLEGLIAAHAMKILHLDIKPANLILVWLPSGRLHVKIVDFGLSRIHTTIEAVTDSTVNRSLIGSIHFMSPEQLNDEVLDGRSDLYSLGCLFYYALSGKHPFEGDTAIRVMASHFRKTPQHLCELRPDLPGPICDWIMSLMARERTGRPGTGLEAMDQLLDLINW